MTIKEIIKRGLIDNGYDGLCRDDCGCGVDDFIPCLGDFSEQCEPAYKIKCKKCGMELYSKTSADSEECDND